MLGLAFLFFIVAIIAGFLGFGNTADELATVAQFFFLLFSVLFFAAIGLKIAVGDTPNDY